MTFRELLNIYRSVELSPEQTREVEEAIDREDALLEYLSERDALPELEERADAAPNNADSETEKKFHRELKRSIRRAFVKLGVMVGAVLLAILLLAQFVLPQVIDRFYYDPGQITAEIHEEHEDSRGTTYVTDAQTNRMTLDMAVYSELFLPGVYRDNVRVVEHGYGEYDVIITQNVAYAGMPAVDVAGHISKGRLLLYDANLFKAPVGNAFEWGLNHPDPALSLSEQIPAEEYDETTGIGTSHAVGMAGYPEDARETLEALEDGKLYGGFVSLDRVMDYDDFYAFVSQFQNQHIWCAVQLAEKPSYLSNWGFGIDYGGGANSLAWDRDKYPMLKRSDGDSFVITDGETAKAHMQDLLRYLGDHPEFAEMMSRDYGASGYTAVTDRPAFGLVEERNLTPLIEYLDEHGVQVYGFWIMADKETLLQLQDSPEVYSVAVQPLR